MNATSRTEAVYISKTELNISTKEWSIQLLSKSVEELQIKLQTEYNWGKKLKKN